MEIRWFKGTDCVCLYKDRQVTEGRGYEGRVSLFTEELQRGNVSLQIRDCRWSDEGDYLCQVTNGDTTEEITVRVKGCSLSVDSRAVQTRRARGGADQSRGESQFSDSDPELQLIPSRQELDEVQRPRLTI
ncbi:hypothetical protein AOLI_G00270790 [Acnodon oligacanthus]